MKKITQINIKGKTKEELKTLLLEYSAQKGERQNMNNLIEELLFFYKNEKK